MEQQGMARILLRNDITPANNASVTFSPGYGAIGVQYSPPLSLTGAPMRRSRLHDVRARRSFALILSVGICGCASGDATGPALNFSGVYSLAQVAQAATCSPQALPAATSATVSLYQQFLPPGSTQVQNTIVHNGTSFNVIPMPGGQPQASITLTGTITNNGDTSVLRAGTFGTEGPRQGGHTFFVTGTTMGIGHMQSNGTVLQLSATYTNTFTFRDGGDTGTVFTTCVFIHTHSGSR
jgi:hypothetical protein